VVTQENTSRAIYSMCDAWSVTSSELSGKYEHLDKFQSSDNT